MGLLLPIMAGGAVALSRAPPCLRLSAPAMVSSERVSLIGARQRLHGSLNSYRKSCFTLQGAVDMARACLAAGIPRDV